MEARVLQDAAGDGRFLLGLGASKIFMKEIGEGEKGKEVGPAVVMRESIEIIRSHACRRGGRVSRQGLRRICARAEARGPRLTRARCPCTWAQPARCCNSWRARTPTACSPPASPRRISCATRAATWRKARARPARIRRRSIWAAVIVGSINRDSQKGKEGAREMAAMYLANKVQNIRGSADVLLQKAGLTFEEISPIADAMEKGGRKAAAQAVTDEVLRKVCAIAGNARRMLRAHRGISPGRLHQHHAGDLGRRPRRAGRAVRRGCAAALHRQEVVFRKTKDRRFLGRRCQVETISLSLITAGRTWSPGSRPPRTRGRRQRWASQT